MGKDPRVILDERLVSLEARVTGMVRERRKRIRAKLRDGGAGSQGTKRLEKTQGRLVQELDSLQSRIESMEEKAAEQDRRSGNRGLGLSNLQELVKQARRLTGTDGIDDFGLDRTFSDTLEPLLEFLYDRYFRVEAKGARASVPSEGPAILVANRGGPIAYDALMIAEAVRKAHPARRLRFQIDPFLGSAPGVGTLFTRVGGVKDIRGNAERLIEEGQLFLFFPEGFEAASKTIDERYRLREMASEFAEVALRLGVPVIPVAVLGSEEAQPVVAGLPLVAKILGWPSFPISATGPLPLPVKFGIRFGKPITVGRATTRARLKARSAALGKRTKGAIEAMLHDLLSSRASLFLG